MLNNQYFRTLRLLGAAAIFMQPGCAGTSLHKAHSQLPVEVAPGAPRLSSVRAFEADERLYVSGSVESGFMRRTPADAHVDISLVGHDGHVIARKRVQMSGRHHDASRNRGRAWRMTFVASFDIEVARRASAIRVSPHAERHMAAAGNGGAK